MRFFLKRSHKCSLFTKPILWKIQLTKRDLLQNKSPEAQTQCNFYAFNAQKFHIASHIYALPSHTRTHTIRIPTTIAMLLSNEPTIEKLLTQELEIEKPTLLELTLNNMKNETIRHAKLTKIKTDYTEDTLKEELQELISQEVSEENMDRIQEKQDELGAFEEQKLFDVLSKKRNFQIFEDERPTARFLALESRKAG